MKNSSKLKLHKNISDSFYKDNDFEKSVVYHELFHCKEMNISNKYVDLQKIFIESRYFTTSYKFLLNIGYMQWSEYYAYFNSTRYHIPNWFLYDDLKNVDISLKSIANIFTQNTISHTHVGISLLNDITNLVACFIRIAACYNSSHNSKYRTEIQKCCKVSNYKYYNPYFLDISCYMNDLYNNYPNWISEEAFIELGKKLISFIGIYGLYLKNGSLHENFEFYKLL